MNSKQSNDSRHYARWYALQKLFNMNFFDDNEQTEDVSSFSDDEIREVDGINSYDTTLAEEIINGVIKHKNQINGIIEKIAPERPIKEISKLNLQILQMAIFEGFIAQITPEKVVINEAIELTREFGDDNSRKFISGALGNLYENKAEFEHLLDTK